MPSKMRHGLFISLVVISLTVIAFNTSYTDTTNYVYDELNRLIRVEYGDGTVIEYIYDKTGNRTHVYVGKYTLTVNVVGGGTVTKNPDQPIYSSGTNVTLTAVNGSDAFSEWSGDLTGSTNPSVIEMDGNKSVTATFVTPEGWLQGWTYRKPVTLSRASGAVTNYQMRLLVGETSGASGEDVDCNGHVLSSFNDLRFTTSDGETLLDYWIESISGTSPNQLATVWIEFDSIGTEATTFYMYYGKADASPGSNGANTFIVFDDFERGINGDNVGGSWTVDAGSCKISTGQKYGLGTRSCKMTSGSDMKIAVTASTTIAIRYRYYKAAQGGLNLTHGNGTKCSQVRARDDEIIDYWNGGGYVATGQTAAIDTWEILELSDIILGTSIDIWKNESQIVNDGACNWNYAGYSNVARFSGAAGESDYTYLDNVIVRHFMPTEPAWGSWGAEEAN